MLSDLYFCANGVLPIFIVALVGYVLKSTGVLTDSFVTCADKLVFRVMLPCMLFTKVAFVDKDALIPRDFGLAGFCVSATLVLTLLLMIFVPAFIKNRGACGAFIQGIFRSNMAFLGVPFAQNLFGDEGARLAAVLIACMIPLYNVLAVIVLCIFDGSEKGNGKNLVSKIINVLCGIVKNPLIIAVVFAVPFCVYGLTLPPFAVKTLGYFSDCASPIALITIGASFRFADLKGRAAKAVTASLIKTVAVPAVMMAVSHYVLGFTGIHLGLVLIAFGTPTAVSSFIMAKNMNSDYKLANQIILLTTLLCTATIFAWSFALRRLGLV